MLITDIRKHNDSPYTGDWTYGTGGIHGRFGGARPDGSLTLYSWAPTGHLITTKVKCATYRKAVRRLRQYLAGY